MAKLSKKQSEALEVLSVLRLRLATAFPARMGKPLPRNHPNVSDAGFTGKSYVMRLREGLTYIEAVDAIMHEYAHFRVWGRLQAMTYEHDAHWGIEYALCYTEWGESG